MMDVRLPDGTIVRNVPDGTTKADLLAKLQRSGHMSASPPNTMEDVAKSAASAVPKGLADVAGFLPSIGEAAANASARLGQFFGASPDRAKSAADLVIGSLPFMPPNFRQMTPDKLVPNAINYQPQTRAGQMTGNAVETGVSALGGGLRAVPSLLSAGGELLADYLSGGNPYARMAGAVAAPTAGGLLTAIKSTPAKMLREATGPLSDADIALAKQRMAQAQAQGINLAAPEALPASSVQSLASDVAASKSGGRIFNKFMENRPAQVQGAVQRGLLDQVGAANTPDINMAAARQAATQVISNAERARSDLVRPFYQAAAGDVIPQPTIEQLVQQAVARQANLTPENQATLAAHVKQLQGTANNAAALDDLYKAQRNRVDLPSIGATPEQRTAAGILGPHVNDLGQAIEASSPNIRAGRDVYRRITEQTINPLTAGPVGRVAGRQGFDPSLPESLNPVSAISNQSIARPASIRELYTHLNGQNPEAFPGIARTWLENALDHASQRIQAGPNRMVGANLAKVVYGTPQQEANFVETMRGVAIAHGIKDPSRFVDGAKNLMETLQLTGRIPNVGSPTASRIPANEMARSSVPAAMAESVSSAPLRGVGAKLREWAMQGNYKRLAEIMTAPDSIEQIVRLGKYRPGTTASQYLVAGMLGLSANDPKAQTPPQ